MHEQASSVDLHEFRRSVVRAGSFQGYKSKPVAFSGLVGLAAAGVQLWLQPGPLHFVLLWGVAAFVGFGYNLFCIARTYGASPRRWERSLAFAALNDLSPAVVTGALLTVALAQTDRFELLPGLWMALFGVGLLSSRRHLPGAGVLVGGLYVLAGTFVLARLGPDVSLRAEVMGSVFGGGQLLLAAVLSRFAR